MAQLGRNRKKQYKIFGRGTGYQAEVKKRRRHGRSKKTSARERRRLNMLSRLRHLKTTSELSFDWSAFFGTYLS